MMKIKASVYGRPLEVTPLSEATCLSAAILGGLGAGIFASVRGRAGADGGRARPGDAVVEPDPEWMERYEELYRTVYAGSCPLALTPPPMMRWPRFATAHRAKKKRRTFQIRRSSGSNQFFFVDQAALSIAFFSGSSVTTRSSSSERSGFRPSFCNSP